MNYTEECRDGTDFPLLPKGHRREKEFGGKTERSIMNFLPPCPQDNMGKRLLTRIRLKFPLKFGISQREGT